MRKFLLLAILIFPVIASAENPEGYRWDLTVFGGGALFCDEAGCFGPSGWAAGGSFGRQFAKIVSFEIDGTYAQTSQILPSRIDLFTGQFYTPELDRMRFYTGLTFLVTVAQFGSQSNFFVAIGGALAYEKQDFIVPEGIFQLDETLGLKGGLSGGAGMNLWFTENWGLRPEVRFYWIASPLSGLRYTGGIVHRF